MSQWGMGLLQPSSCGLSAQRRKRMVFSSWERCVSPRLWPGRRALGSVVSSPAAERGGPATCRYLGERERLHAFQEYRSTRTDRSSRSRGLCFCFSLKFVKMRQDQEGGKHFPTTASSSGTRLGTLQMNLASGTAAPSGSVHSSLSASCELFFPLKPELTITSNFTRNLCHQHGSTSASSLPRLLFR